MTSKKEVFIKGLQQEIDSPKHPLNIFLKNMICLDIPKTDIKNPLLLSIREFYDVFDPEMYTSFGESGKGIITKIVWAKYREKTRAIKIKSDRKNNRNDFSIKLMDGCVSSEKKVPLNLEREFLRWVSGMKNYDNPITDVSPIQFSMYNEFSFKDCKQGLGTNCIEGFQYSIKQKTKNHEDILKALLTLSKHKKASNLIVMADMRWFSRDAYPESYCCIDPKEPFVKSRYYPISSQTLIGWKEVKILGIKEVEGKHYITTNETADVYKTFPRRFYKLESRNSRETQSTVFINYLVEKCISKVYIIYTDDSGNFKRYMTIKYTEKGNPKKLNPLEIFSDIQKERLIEISKKNIQKLTDKRDIIPIKN